MLAKLGRRSPSTQVCSRRPCHKAKVLEDEAEAARLGITGVPTYVLDQRYFVVGAQPYDVLKRAIEKAVKTN